MNTIMPQPKFLLIVKVPAGLVILDRPSPRSKGAVVRRAEKAGTALEAYSIHNILGVPYARLVPREPNKPEWVRVKEADSSVEYVDVIDLTEDEDEMNVSEALLEIAAAIRESKGT